MTGLTDRQREILAFISWFIAEYGYPPSIREIGVAFDFRSTYSTVCHLVALERKGAIERDPKMCRGIRVLGAA